MHELRIKKQQGVIMKIDFEKAYDRVNWEFVEEVMKRKGFHEQFIQWVMLSVRSGRVCIKINGQLGTYFRTYRGLRQGDPISPILFNLAADVLVYTLDQAKNNGQLVGVVPHLIQGGLTHIQYAGDIVIMMSCEERSITNMKFLLYCFEWMSGQKINYHKSEVIVFGVEDEVESSIANALNCNVGSLAMIYLGLPISDRVLGAGAFNFLGAKLRKRLQPWKDKNMSYGARIILSNTSLGNLPTMGFFLLKQNVHLGMDTIRSQFFWRGNVDKFKYHMMKWEHLTTPKDFGGLGIINTRNMNVALLGKWIWRLYENREEDMCCQLLRKKYLGVKPFSLARSTGVSQFWQGLFDIRSKFEKGFIFQIHNGQSVLF